MTQWNKTESLQYLQNKIKEVRTAMLTTYSQDKGFRSRPMGTADVDSEGNIWFFTDEFSQKVSDISVENMVSLTYSDPKNHTYLSIVGEASIVNDEQKKKDLWNPFVKAFFPNGVDDPKLTLIKIIPHDAEYWDSSSSSMVVLFHVLKAAVTGKQYNEGEHGKIEL